MVMDLKPDAMQTLSQLLRRYANDRKKAVQRDQITPQEAVTLMLTYGDGIEHTLRIFLQEDRFQPHAAVNQLRMQLAQAVLSLDPNNALNHPM